MDSNMLSSGMTFKINCISLSGIINVFPFDRKTVVIKNNIYTLYSKLCLNFS